MGLSPALRPAPTFQAGAEILPRPGGRREPVGGGEDRGEGCGTALGEVQAGD